MTTEIAQIESKEHSKKSKKGSRAGAEAGPRIGLIPGLYDVENRTISMTGEAAQIASKLVKGAAKGASVSDALIAATLNAMQGPMPKVAQKPAAVEASLTLPKAVWAYQEALAKESGCTIEEAQEAILRAYQDARKPR